MKKWASTVLTLLWLCVCGNALAGSAQISLASYDIHPVKMSDF